MKVIAAETPPPIGPEFWEVVEGQRVGITIEQGLERMYERMPLQEVNFLCDRPEHPVKDWRQPHGDTEQPCKGASRPSQDEEQDPLGFPGSEIIGGHHRLPAASDHRISELSQSRLSHSSLHDLARQLPCCRQWVWMLTGILVMRKMINFNI